MFAGPDIEGLTTVLGATTIPLIASGGVGGLSDLLALRAIEVDGRRLAGVIVGRGAVRGPARHRGGDRRVLATRVIPCLDVDAGRVVKGIRFVEIRDAGDPVELAARYDAEGADELVFLDITASSDDRDTMVHVVERVAEQVFIPFTVGGGIRSVDDVRRMLRAGADKVSLNTAAVADPELVRRASEEFGAQCIVVAIDARLRGLGGGERGRAVVGRRHARRTHAHRVRRRRVGAGGRRAGCGGDPAHVDGPRRHPGRLRPRAAAQRSASAVTVPVIASGGVGTLEHMYEAVSEGGADAVLAASIFHFGTFRVVKPSTISPRRGS